MSAKYEIKQAKDGKFYFNLKASNGQVILISQIYKDKGGAKNGIASVQQNSPSMIFTRKKKAPATKVFLC
jgi:uncharacterized protein YegP (UPF0339 family)